MSGHTTSWNNLGKILFKCCFFVELLDIWEGSPAWEKVCNDKAIQNLGQELFVAKKLLLNKESIYIHFWLFFFFFQVSNSDRDLLEKFSKVEQNRGHATLTLTTKEGRTVVALHILQDELDGWTVVVILFCGIIAN